MAARIFSFQLFTFSLLGFGTMLDCTNGDGDGDGEAAAAAGLSEVVVAVAEEGSSHSALPVVG